MSLVPFQRHSANVDELYSCGAGLIGTAAAALDNATLTSQTYQPAIDNWDGMCAPELANARNPIIGRADEAHNALAWASVVASYWADRVDKFNSAVDRIMETAGNDPYYGATGVDGEPPSEEAVDAARFAAEQRWWTAYNDYILDGEDEAAAMLRDGPTDQHLAVLGEAGVLPPAPPGAINTLNWAGHFVNGIIGGLGAYSAWRGSHWYSSVNGRPNTSNAAYWRLQQSMLSSDARYHYNRMQGAQFDLRSGRTWVNGQWVQPGRPTLVNNYYRASDAYQSATQRAANAGVSSQTHAAAAGRWGTAARAAGPVGHALTAGTSAWDQWSQDAGRNDLSTDDRVVRAGTQAAATTGGAAAGAWAGAKGGAVVGAAIGSVFPGPGTAIGAVAGGIIGGAVGGWLGSEAGGALADAGMEGVTNAYNGAKDAVSSAASTVKGWFGG